MPMPHPSPLSLPALLITAATSATILRLYCTHLHQLTAPEDAMRSRLLPQLVAEQLTSACKIGHSRNTIFQFISQP
jgi:hypothetical protein